MPLVYQQNINHRAGIGLWQITEEEDFFSSAVRPLHPITNGTKRLQHLTALYTLKSLHADFPFTRVRVAESGRPYLEGEEGFFSLSHSGNFAAAAISERFRVGIDVENYHVRIHKVVPRFLSDAERYLLSESADKASGLPHVQVFTAAWSVKEALYKWQGGPGLDFIRDLHIDAFSVCGETGEADCRVGTSELKAGFRFFTSCCMAWVVG